MHSIDKWYVTNLNSRPEKWDAQELVSVIQGMPPGILTRFPCAIENEDIPATHAELCELIRQDGFPEWADARIHTTDRPLSLLAADWTKLQVLRLVIEDGESAVITTDNAYLIDKFDKVEELIRALPENLNALYLHWSSEPDVPGHIEAMSQLEPSGMRWYPEKLWIRRLDYLFHE